MSSPHENSQEVSSPVGTVVQVLLLCKFTLTPTQMPLLCKLYHTNSHTNTQMPLHRISLDFSSLRSLSKKIPTQADVFVRAKCKIFFVYEKNYIEKKCVLKFEFSRFLQILKWQQLQWSSLTDQTTQPGEYLLNHVIMVQALDQPNIEFGQMTKTRFSKCFSN